jgi:hypothetical protein
MRAMRSLVVALIALASFYEEISEYKLMYETVMTADWICKKFFTGVESVSEIKKHCTRYLIYIYMYIQNKI